LAWPCDVAVKTGQDAREDVDVYRVMYSVEYRGLGNRMKLISLTSIWLSPVFERARDILVVLLGWSSTKIETGTERSRELRTWQGYWACDGWRAGQGGRKNT